MLVSLCEKFLQRSRKLKSDLDDQIFEYKQSHKSLLMVIIKNGSDWFKFKAVQIFGISDLHIKDDPAGIQLNLAIS